MRNYVYLKTFEMWVGFVFVVVTNIFRTTRPCSIFSQHWRFKHILQTPPATSWESAHDLIFHAEYHPITFLLHDYASFSRISRMSTPLHISRAPKWRDYSDLANNSQVKVTDFNRAAFQPAVCVSTRASDKEPIRTDNSCVLSQQLHPFPPHNIDTNFGAT